MDSKISYYANGNMKEEHGYAPNGCLSFSNYFREDGNLEYSVDFDECGRVLEKYIYDSDNNLIIQEYNDYDENICNREVFSYLPDESFVVKVYKIELQNIDEPLPDKPIEIKYYNSYGQFQSSTLCAD